MSTVISIMDRPGLDANTDNIVVVRPRRRSLVWVPRDLWVPGQASRINRAFANGSHDGLISGLRELGQRVQHSVCIERAAAEAVLSNVRVTVPVDRPLRFWYPLEPQRRLEEGRRLVAFDPPEETLSGTRVHEWIGARYQRDRPGSDLDRIERQQVFLTALLRAGFDFASACAPHRELISASSPAALQEARRVNAAWRSRTMDGLLRATIDGKKVLVKRRLPGRLGRRDLRRRVARWGGTLD